MSMSRVKAKQKQRRRREKRRDGTVAKRKGKGRDRRREGAVPVKEGKDALSLPARKPSPAGPIGRTLGLSPVFPAAPPCPRLGRPFSFQVTRSVSPLPSVCMSIIPSVEYLYDGHKPYPTS